MTTVLDRSLAREVMIEGHPFKVVISPTGVRVTEKGHRKGTEVTWETILARGQKPMAVQPQPVSPSDLPPAVAADVAREVQKASQALGRARDALSNSGSVPAMLLSDIEPDRLYGRIEHDSDWFIEPLLTAEELASILRVSKTTAAHLPIPAVQIAGERRFRQSEVRQYLARQETRSR
jgi:hypothetical protein